MCTLANDRASPSARDTSRLRSRHLKRASRPPPATVSGVVYEDASRLEGHMATAKLHSWEYTRTTGTDTPGGDWEECDKITLSTGAVVTFWRRIAVRK